MDLFEFGMRHESSASPWQRGLAKGIIALEEKKAKWYEAYLERRGFTVPEDPETERAMLENIMAKVSEREKG